MSDGGARTVGDLRRNPVLVALVTGILGPAALAIGTLNTSKALAVRGDYAHAQAVRATVIEARYLKVDHSQAQRIVVAVQDSRGNAVIDDVASAPDYLTPGETVDVLTSPGRPGHALFASELGWSKLAEPIGGIAVGVVVLGVFVRSVVGARRLARQQEWA